MLFNDLKPRIDEHSHQKEVNHGTSTEIDDDCSHQKQVGRVNELDTFCKIDPLSR